MALTGAVRKGGLLSGKVSQGETSPLKPCVKGLRSGPEKNTTLVVTLGMALFFFWHGVRHGVRHGVGMPLGMIWHAVGGRVEPCRGALC